MTKRILITGLLGAILGVYSFTAYRTLHSLQIFFVSNTLGKIYAYTYLITTLLSVVMIMSFISSIVKAVKKRKNPQPERDTAEPRPAPAAEVPQTEQPQVSKAEDRAATGENQEVQYADESATEIDIPDDERELGPVQPAEENVTEID